MTNTNKKVNTESSEKLFKLWGLAYAREQGQDVTGDELVRLNAYSTTEGCCEMCASEVEYLELEVGNYSYNFYSSYISG